MKKHPVIKTILIIVAVILVLALGLLFVMTRDWNDEPLEDFTSDNPYITELGKTMVSAHRSGGEIFPENTMMAFKGNIESEDFKTDIFEFDLHITKDKELIILHDDTFDRTSDACEIFGTTDIKPEDYTYEELRSINLGETFTTADGSTPYKGLRGDDVPDDLRVASLRDVLTYLQSNGDFSYIIEIKNGDELGYESADILYSTLKELGLLEKAVVGTFNGEVTQYIDDNYPDMLRSAGIKEVLGFYFSSLLGIDHEDGYYKFKALQIPANQFVVHLGTSRLVNYAHENNIAVQYWTINDEETMEMLRDIGADCIMSDNPALCYEVVNGGK